MRLADLLDVQRVAVSLEASDKEGVLWALARLFCHAGSELSVEAIYRVFAEREGLASTGVGSGVAIPHGRLAGLESMKAAIAIHRRGVPFDAVDDQAAQIFVAVLAPERRPSEHLKALARISRLLRDEQVRQRLMDVTEPREVIDLVASEDDRH